MKRTIVERAKAQADILRREFHNPSLLVRSIILCLDLIAEMAREER